VPSLVTVVSTVSVLSSVYHSDSQTDKETDIETDTHTDTHTDIAKCVTLLTLLDFNRTAFKDRSAFSFCFIITVFS